MTLAERLHELRTSRGLSMKEAGIAAGYPPRSARAAWWNYESGALVNPCVSHLYRFAVALNMSASEFLHNVDDPLDTE